MGKEANFIKIDREEPEVRPKKERIKDSKEIYKKFPDQKLKEQASRCMDCGIPFCHNGCPLGNYIPDFNDAVTNNEWKQAFDILLKTNNFPEFTGRICPAPCESSCVLAINKPAVTIELIEKSIIEKAFSQGWVKPKPPSTRTSMQVAIVGSGPAGLAAADQLNKVGHLVDVYEKDSGPGGLLRYGIPDFKLEKWVIDRRIELMEKEGIRFFCDTAVGKDISLKKLRKKYDAVLLCIGSTKPRALKIPNAEAKGVYFAMDFLVDHNKVVAGEKKEEDQLSAYGKDVIVIGGGDTGSDCVGTANRHGAKSITQFQYRPKPPFARSTNNPWPEEPFILTSSSSHEEGCERVWGWLTKGFIVNSNNKVTGLKMSELQWKNEKEYVEVENSEKIFPCDMAFIAIGYERPVYDKMGFDFNVNNRGNISVNDWQTSVPGVFAAGDASRGQSLVVWAISDGREAAKAIDTYLAGTSSLPSKHESFNNLKNEV